MDELEKELLDIERAGTDPHLTELIQEVKGTNELLAAQICTEAEAQKLISTLNRRWIEHGFHNTEFFLSGEAYVGGIFEDFEKDSMLDEAAKTSFPFRYPFTSEGFCLIQSTELTEEGLEVRQEIVARGRIVVDDEDSADGQADKPCFIKLNETNRFDCDAVTPGKAEVWLSTYHSELYAELVETVLNSKDEAEATMRLGAMRFPILDTSVENAKDFWAHLETFLNHALEYDCNVPYLAEVCGECHLLPLGKSEFQKTNIMSDPFSLLIIDRLFFAYNGATNELDAFVRGMLLQGAKRVHTPIHIPLTSIYSIEAGRTIYEAWRKEASGE